MRWFQEFYDFCVLVVCGCIGAVLALCAIAGMLLVMPFVTVIGIANGIGAWWDRK